MTKNKAKKQKGNYPIFSKEPYEDNFSISFEKGSEGQAAMYEFLKSLKKNGRWLYLTTKEIGVNIVSGGPLILSDVKNNYTFLPDATDDVILNTIENGESMDIPGTQLIITSKDVTPGKNIAMCLSDTGEKSLISKSGTSCPAMSRITDLKDKKTMIDIGIKTTGDKTVLILYRFQKIRAFNGGKTYNILDQSELFKAMLEYFKQYQDTEFLYGNYQHDRTTAKWILPEETKKILKTYNAICKKIQFTKNIDFCLTYELITSDLGDSAVYVKVRLERGSYGINLGNPISILHTGDKNISDFSDAINTLLAKTQDLVTNLEKLVKVKIKYPENTIIGLAKEIGLTENATIEAILSFQNMYVDIPKITAHDIFYVLQESLYNMQIKNVSSSTLEQCEENLARLLTPSFRGWKEKDKALRPEWK